MIYFLYFLVGGAAGVLGGMGMGGGTLLIPLLSIFFGAPQHEAQAVNLVAFLPMAIASLAIHFKNKRIETKGLLLAVIPACVFSLLGGLAANFISGELLKKIFGAFLIAISVLSFFTAKNSSDE